MTHPVYIPSRGRASTCLTAEELVAAGVDFTLVVEPHDRQDYIDGYGVGRCLVLDEDNRGIAFARNAIKRFSIARGEKSHWQLDDNIKAFRRRVDGKNVKWDPSDLMREAEDYVSSHTNIGISSLAYTTFAWSARHYVSINNQAASAFLVDNEVDIWWRADVGEDTDYSLQVLDAGYCTAKFNTLLIDKTETMKMAGGCTEIEYGGDGRLRRSLGVQRNWPGWFEVNTETQRLKPSRIWRSFQQRPIPIST